jgi:hypothetical protein
MKPLLFIFIAGICYGILATLQFHYSVSIFSEGNQFWDASVSWMNKYSNIQSLQRKEIVAGVVLPVLFTDGYHLVQSIFLLFVFLTIIFYKRITHFFVNHALNYLVDFILLRSVFGLGFVLMYNLILVK